MLQGYSPEMDLNSIPIPPKLKLGSKISRRNKIHKHLKFQKNYMLKSLGSNVQITIVWNIMYSDTGWARHASGL